MQKKGLLGQLIQHLCTLPGVGPKTAQRMAFQLLQRKRDNAKALADILARAVAEISQCQQCRTLTEQTLCEVCSDTARDASLLCIVESPADVWTVEQTGIFNGRYFVLHGHLSPLDGIGPEELGLDALEQLLAKGYINELVLATNSTLEGNATAYYINELANKHNITANRIAHGVPIGGELEFIDRNTLALAFKGRRRLEAL